MSDRLNLRAKITLDGRRCQLLRGAVQLVVITWSNKNERFYINYKDDRTEKELESDIVYMHYLAEVLYLLGEYKKEADALEKRKEALQKLL